METVYNSKNTLTIGAVSFTSVSAPTVVGSTALYGALAGSNTVSATSATFSATPAAAANVLTVIGSSTTGNVVQFSNTAGGNFIMTSAGNVGIGKTNPVAPLDVAGTVITSGQVQSLDSLRAHSLPSDAMIVASSTLVTPTNQNPGSYAIVESAGATALTNNVVAAVTQSPFADLYKEGSMYFPGSVNSNIFCTTGSYGIASGLTAECWLYPTSFTGSVVNIGGSPTNILMPCTLGAMIPSSAGTVWSLGTNTTGNVVFYYYSSGGSQSVTSITQLSANTWNHIAATISSGNIFLFINGVQTQVAANRGGTLQTAAYYEPVQGTPNFVAYAGVGATGTAYTTGYIADARIVSGTPVYTGSTSSFATFTVPSAPLSPAATGTTQFLLRAGQNSPTVQNGALTFDRGLKQFMNFGPQTFNVVTQGFTAIWRGSLTGTVGTYERIFEFGAVNTSTGAAITAIRTAGAGTVSLTIYPTNSGTSPGSATSAISLTQGVIYTIAFRYNPVTQLSDIWINGQFSASQSVTTAALVADRTVAFTYMGRPSDSASFTSMTSNTLAIYNRALSNVEILNAYSALTTTPATPLQKTLEIGDINGVPALSVAGNGQVFMDSIGLSSNVVPWPPAAMTGYDTVINGGVYKARASSENSGYYAWYAFDKNTTNFWNWGFGAGNFYPGGAGITYGYYTGPVTTTDTQGTVYKGEWIQLQLPTRISLSSYTVYGQSTTYDPGTFFILGSNDGVSWFLVNSQVSVPWTTTPQTLTFQAQSSQTFSYFRMVIGAIMSSGTNNYSLPFSEWTLYGTADASPTLTIAPATVFNTSVATPSLTGIAAAGVYAPQDFSTSGLNIPAYVVSNTATVANTVQYSTMGPFAGEGSLYFPGGFGAYVNFPSSAMTLWPGGSTSPVDATVECWVYLTQYNSGNSFIFTRGGATGGASANWYLLVQSTGTLVMQLNSTTASLFGYSSGTVPLNTWTHVAGTVKGNVINAYINGVVGTSGTFSGTFSGSSTDQFFINNFQLSSTQNIKGGYVACARIVSGLALYTGTFTPPTGPLQPIQGTTQAGLPYGTVLLLRNAPAPGRIQTTKFSGANSGTVLSFPPAAMTSYATALNAGYGQGTYVASASSEFSTDSVWKAFDKNEASVWQVLGWSSSAPYGPIYTTTTTDVTGTAYTGEWCQIQLHSSIVLSSYQMLGSYYATTASPGKWWVLGSRDGTSWFLVDQRSGVTNGTSKGTYPVSASQAFTHYRMVINQLQGNNQYGQVTEWTLNGTIESVNVTADGRLGVGVTNPARALEVAGDVVCAGTLSAGNPLMFRNRIINGDMRIAQRGTSITASGYNLDRWAANFNAGNMTIAQSTSVPLGQGFSNSVSLVMNATIASGTGGAWYFRQSIEGYNVSDFGFGNPAGAGTFTVSFWLTSSLAGTMTVTLMNTADTRSYLTTISVGNYWQKYTLTIPVDAGATSISTTTASALALHFVFQSGTSTTTTNTWLASQTWWLSNTTNYMVNGTTINITGVQLEKGTVATPFEFRNYAQELALCQRYFQKSLNIETAPGTATEVGNWSIFTPYAVANGNNLFISGPSLQVSMRGTPTIVFYGSSGAIDTTWNALAGSSASTWRYLNNTSGVTQNQGTTIGLAWTASTEL